MPLPRRLRRAWTWCGSTLVLSMVIFSMTAPTAQAGPAPGLCQMNTSRGSIPASFAIDACINKTDVYLRNNLTIALTVEARGNSGLAKRTGSDYGLAADATRLKSHDPWLLLPGDTLRIPFGSGPASFRVFGSPLAGFYALATVVQTFIPGTGPAVIGAFTTLVTELNADFVQYKECLVGKNWVGQLGCEALRTRNVSFAIARAGVTGIAHGALAVILAAATFVKWADVQVPAVEAVRDSGVIRVTGVAPPPPTPTANPQPSARATAAPAHYSIGSAFQDECVVAWPTAPTITSDSIIMTMSCQHVPESEFLFVQVTYDDPSLHVTPDTGSMEITGHIADIAQSDYGYRELIVQASHVSFGS
jgi:hypothetical protein